MNKELSTKLSIINFLLLLGVVLIHSYVPEISKEKITFFWYFQDFMSYGILDSAVPLFFFISGFLFFRNMDMKSNAFQQIGKKLKKRFRTLLLPYLVWCTLWFLALYVIQNLPFFESFFKSPFKEMTLAKQMYFMLWEPVNYPFWFIRELIFYFLLSPLLYLLLKWSKWFIIPMIFLLSLFQNSLLVVLDVEVVKFNLLGYFLLGSYFGIKKNGLSWKMSQNLLLPLICLWFVFTIIVKYYENLGALSFVLNILKDVAILIGCISIWQSYDKLEFFNGLKDKSFLSQGFFLFATHGIPLLLINELVSKTIAPTGILSFTFYILNFVGITVLAVLAGTMIKKITPKLYSSLTGGR